MTKNEKKDLYSISGAINYAKELLETAHDKIDNPVKFFKSEAEMNKYKDDRCYYPYIYGALTVYIYSVLNEITKVEEELNKLNK